VVVYGSRNLEAVMPTVASRTFRDGDGEAVILPDDVAYGAEIDVTITRSGDVITIRPANRARISMSEMLKRLDELPAPDEIEVRDADVVPDHDD
jgi:antitoxin VapB